MQYRDNTRKVVVELQGLSGAKHDDGNQSRPIGLLQMKGRIPYTVENTIMW